MKHTHTSLKNRQLITFKLAQIYVIIFSHVPYSEFGSVSSHQRDMPVMSGGTHNYRTTSDITRRDMPVMSGRTHNYRTTSDITRRDIRHCNVSVCLSPIRCGSSITPRDVLLTPKKHCYLYRRFNKSFCFSVLGLQFMAAIIVYLAFLFIWFIGQPQCCFFIVLVHFVLYCKW